MGYVYRVEYVDGWLGRHTSALLTPAQGSVSLLLPDSWTAAGGTGEIRLEAALLGGESSEEQILSPRRGGCISARASSARAGRGPVRKASLH